MLSQKCVGFGVQQVETLLTEKVILTAVTLNISQLRKTVHAVHKQKSVSRPNKPQPFLENVPFNQIELFSKQPDLDLPVQNIF